VRAKSLKRGYGNGCGERTTTTAIRPNPASTRRIELIARGEDPLRMH
jgi:hypothetical protein